MNTRVLLVMGVSGSGKTTIGQALAQSLGWVFADADDYHPEPNRRKMQQGQALSDTDREPWLLRLRALIEEHLGSGQPLVLACSALKERYRQTLTQGLSGVEVVFLQGNRELIAARMQNREHFMPVSLLESQLSALEPPKEAIAVDISQSIQTIVERVLEQVP